MTQARILIADDSSLIRESLQHLLDMQPTLKVVSVAENGFVALEQVRALNPDIVLLDVSMPQLSGLEALPMIKEFSHSIEVIMLSMHGLDSFVLQALHSGAAGYVLKTAAASQILEAIQSVRSGCQYLSPQLIRGEVEKVIIAI